MVKLADALRGVTSLGLDTAPIIYFVEAHPQDDALMQAVFQRIRAGTPVGITSVVTLSEAMVRPLATGDRTLQAAYRQLLRRSAAIRTVEIGPGFALRAAALRGHYGMLLPDALQVAAALQSGCQAFLSNDRRLQRVTELRVLLLDDLEL